MSKHRTTPVPYMSGDWYVARRKGRSIRMRNRVTGAMTRWARIPRPTPAFLASYIEGSAERTVPELRRRATHYGVAFTTKTRKGDLLDAIAVEAWYDLYRVRSA